MLISWILHVIWDIWEDAIMSGFWEPNGLVILLKTDSFDGFEAQVEVSILVQRPN